MAALAGEDIAIVGHVTIKGSGTLARNHDPAVDRVVNRSEDIVHPDAQADFTVVRQAATKTEDGVTSTDKTTVFIGQVLGKPDHSAEVIDFSRIGVSRTAKSQAFTRHHFDFSLRSIDKEAPVIKSDSYIY